MTTHFDIVIIGTGAGGSTLAHRLAPSGHRVLLLERGDFIPREPENWAPRAVVTDGRYVALETWRDADGRAIRPFTHYCVGGNTKMYGAALLRLRRDDFGPIRHRGGTSPAWPFAYDELEPYYTEAEWLYTVHGRRGIDPLDPPAHDDYPYPALPHEPRIHALYEDLEALDYGPYPLPLGLRPHRARGDAPVLLQNFDGYPDPTEIKADAHVVALRPALRHQRVELWTRAKATRLLTDPSGRQVVAVEVERDGERCLVRADLFVVACGAINSAALLLRSANDEHPRGLANGSDQVGRNYMTHHNGMLIAYGDEPNPSRFQKTFGIGGFYRGGKHGPDPLGSVQLMGRLDADSLAALGREQLPDVDARDLASHCIDLFLTTEDLPTPDNRITVDAEGKITVRYRPNNLASYEELRRQTEMALTRADARHHRRAPRFLHARLGISSVSHQCGTLRMGTEPSSSVVDPTGRAHGLHNLYVGDSSVFPASGAVNPSLTIMALALRLGDTLLARLG